MVTDYSQYVPDCGQGRRRRYTCASLCDFSRSHEFQYQLYYLWSDQQTIQVKKTINTNINY